MLIVLSMDTILIGGMIAISLYSLVEMLFAASFLELQLLTSLMTVLLLLLNIGALIYFVANQLTDSTDATESVTKKEGEEDVLDMMDVMEETMRIVEEKDGRITITRTYTPAAAEVREMVEKSPPLESPKQETTEFADLLEAEKKSN